MKDKYKALATYNAEVALGIVHTKEWVIQMNKLQGEYRLDQYNEFIDKNTNAFYVPNFGGAQQRAMTPDEKALAGNMNNNYRPDKLL